MNSKDYGLELKYAPGAQIVSDGTQIEGYASLFGLTDQGLKSVVVASIGYRSEQDFNASLTKSRLPAEQLFTRL